jgi:hypothetical protein
MTTIANAPIPASTTNALSVAIRAVFNYFHLYTTPKITIKINRASRARIKVNTIMFILRYVIVKRDTRMIPTPKSPHAKLTQSFPSHFQPRI